MFEQPSGTFAITEQGDLGLGLISIDESVTQDKKDKNEDEKKRKSELDRD